MQSPPQDLPGLLVVVGPTASGKTAFAVRLAESVGGEVVSADSVQIYRRFEIGAGKPSDEERRRVPHHLIDAVEPMEPMDAARWAALAERVIADVRARGRVPVVCGGTFLWVRALVYGLAAAPPADAAIRARHQALVDAEGRPSLHARLGELDAQSAARLAPNDFVRVSRALEVFELTGQPLTEWHARHGFREPRFAARLLGIRWSAEELSARIELRVRSMLRAGLVREVRSLERDGYAAARAMKSVGYRQTLAALARGAVDDDALAVEIVRATRIFARRQRTWLREEAVEWLTADAAQRFKP